MNDHDNEIDALLRIWSVSPLEDHRRYRAALTALVAERDALWKERDELLKENVALRDRLKAKQDEVLDRVFEMDAMRQQRDEARREVCELDAEIYGHFGDNYRLVVHRASYMPMDVAKERGWDCFAKKEGGGA